MPLNKYVEGMRDVVILERRGCQLRSIFRTIVKPWEQ
jgi:hypothetical protein